MRFPLLPFVFILFFSLSPAQQLHTCGSDHYLEQHYKNEQKARQSFDTINKRWETYSKSNTNDWLLHDKQARNPSLPIKTVKVVIHDISANNQISSFLNGGNTSTISDYQYIVDKLNYYFSGANPASVITTNPDTTPVDTRIRFCLAQTKANGDAYTVNDSRRFNPYSNQVDINDYNAIVSLIGTTNSPTDFPSTHYLNIYIIDQVSQGYSGFASMPQSHGLVNDGIFVVRSTVQNDVNIDTNIKVLVHEAGHYFGLFHVFGICNITAINSLTVNNYNPCSCDNFNCYFNGDMVCDTPPSMMNPAGYIAPGIVNTCNPTDGINDMKQNFMDYGVQEYLCHFTPGQVARMQFMIDEATGPRRTLFDVNSSCTSCTLFDGCNFAINSSLPPTLRGDRIEFYLNGQVLQFTINSSCSINLSTTTQISWTLQNANSGVVLNQGIGMSFSFLSALGVGNYRLLLKITSVSNSDCFRDVVYDFTVNPDTTNLSCNLVPNSNAISSWTNAQWELISVVNGWSIQNNIYPIGSVQANQSQPNFNSSGFDVISVTNGPVVGPMGMNLVPPTPNIQRIFRVGMTNGGGGKAFYAKKTITINRNNCRFKVWFLGATQGSKANTQLPFHNLTVDLVNKNDAAFGLLTQYRYHSPLVTSSASNPITQGLNDTGGNLFIYTKNGVKNTLLSQVYNSSLSDFTQIGGFRCMTQWKSFELDFSDFVDLTSDTEITLTFFSHSNTAANALQESFCYYGLECLGGGVPSNFELDVQNISQPCQVSDRNCVSFRLPSLEVDTFSLQTPQPGFLHHVTVYEIIGGVPSPAPSATVTITNDGLNICLDDYEINNSLVPYKDFRIVYQTMHQLIEKDFRVHLGFYMNQSVCMTGDTLESATVNGTPLTLVNGSILLCDTFDLPLLNLTDTCVTGDVEYQWYYKNEMGLSFIIQGATGASLQLTHIPQANFNVSALNTDFNFSPEHCGSYYRKVKYKDPYCWQDRTKSSEEFKVLSRAHINFGFSTAIDNDICNGDMYQVVIKDARLNIMPLCYIPDTFTGLDVPNTIFVQLYDPTSNQLIGQPQVFNFNNQLPFFGMPLGDLTFNFDNINPSNPNQPLFFQNGATNSFPIEVVIYGTYLGCTISYNTHQYPLQDIFVNQSALGGQITKGCGITSITSLDPGFSFGNQNGLYEWEYSYDNITFFTIPQQYLATLSTTDYIPFIQSNTPLYIRRKSLGNGNCTNPQYSNVVFVSSNTSSSVSFISSSLPNSVCKYGQAPTLPSVSSNGVYGIWIPSTVSVIQSGTYTFYPLTGYCLPSYIHTIALNDPVVPTFAPIPAICEGGTINLPFQSLNGITGTWSPTVNNTQTTVYTFQPDSQFCALTAELEVIVYNQQQQPIFNLPNAICPGMTPPVLPSLSVNQIQGTWSPPQISLSQGGLYTFTPNFAECSTTLTIQIDLLSDCNFTLDYGNDVNCELSNNPRPNEYDTDISTSSCQRVCANSILDYTINGDNLNAIAFIDWQVTGGQLISQTSNSCQISWGSSPMGQVIATLHLTNGSILQYIKCVEKVIAPVADFTIYSGGQTDAVFGCRNNPVYFTNTSTANNGNSLLYYSWNFGDGTTSNEFEPSHTYTQYGVFTITLMVFNGCGCVSKIEKEIQIVKSNITLNCPAVTCQNSIETYQTDSLLAGYCTTVNWVVDGGTIVSSTNNNTQVSIEWNNPGPDGFGYVSVSAPGCAKCMSRIKIPVVSETGTIKGDSSICTKTQQSYSLPQWPSTDFQWTIDDGGTGAILITTNDRNSVVINSQGPGVVVLHCSYVNTLLGCSGTASLVITVGDRLQIDMPNELCQGSFNYEFYNDAGIIHPITWQLDGPNGFQSQGNGAIVSENLTESGTYILSVIDGENCFQPRIFKVLESPSAPTSIVGVTSTVCAGLQQLFSCDALPGFIPHWSVTNGVIVGSPSGHQVTVDFSTDPSVSEYQLSVWYEGPTCNSLPYTVTLYRYTPSIFFNIDSLVACGSSYSNFSINETDMDFYEWTIIPSSAGSVSSGQNTNAVTILWNQNSGATINPQVKLRVRKCNVEVSDTMTISVLGTPNVILNPNTDYTVCANEPFQTTFGFSVGTQYDHYTIDFGDGSIPVDYTFALNSTNNFSISHFFPQYTQGQSQISYPVTMTVYNPGGCLGQKTIHFNVIVYTVPIVEISYPSSTSYCLQYGLDPSNYTCSVIIQSGFSATYSVQWFKNGLPISGSLGTSTTINFSDSSLLEGIYYVQVTNQNGCVFNSESIEINEHCQQFPGPNEQCTCPSEISVTTQCDSVLAILNLQNTCNLDHIDWLINLNNNYTSVFTTNSSAIPYSVQDLNPGKYTIRAELEYVTATGTCRLSNTKEFIIPYKADLTYLIGCNSGGNYAVTLLDHSEVYPLAGIGQYEFSINNGPWISTGSVDHLNLSLAPGTYTFGLRISQTNYPSCTSYKTVELPALPNPDFTFVGHCQNQTVLFTPVDQTPGNQYEWTFLTSIKNLQMSPSFVFTNFGDFQVILKVTNKYGCQTTITKEVSIERVNLQGFLTASPSLSCSGVLTNISFNPYASNILPSFFEWYYLNNPDSNPQLLTTTSVPNLEVALPGIYFVYVYNQNSCREVINPSVIIKKIPKPEPPTITGENLVCVETPYELALTPLPLLHYSWELNGVPRPDLIDQTTITETQIQAGTYTYTVRSRYEYFPGYFCESEVSTYVVTVTNPPSPPVIDVQVISCNPYLVKLHVANVQNGVSYNWSNGMVGSDILVEHDGALLVRAELFNCSAESQLDLPRDLTKLKWTFPSGCFDVCSKRELGYLIGPGGYFSHWSWYGNGMLLDEGDDLISNLSPLELNQEYSLILQEGNCSTTLQTATIKEKGCTTCPLEIVVDEIRCVSSGAGMVYSITITTINAHTNYLNAQISLDGSFGFFDTSTLLIPPGSSQQLLLLHGNPTSSGASVMFQLESMFKEQLCYSEFPIVLPAQCTADAICPDQLRYEGYSCINTLSGPLYQLEFTINNPNPIAVPLTITPSIAGLITTSVNALPSNSSTVTFGYLPQSNLNGQPVTFAISSSLPPFSCNSSFEARLLPPNCTDPLDCHIDVTNLTTPCIDGTTFVMGAITMSLTNNSSVPIQLSFHVPGQELTLSQSQFTLLPGVHTPIVMLPNAINGFTGGQVVLEIIAFDGDRYCTQRLVLDIEVCCPNCKINTSMSPSEPLGHNVLKVAPNHVLDFTKIFYIFEGAVEQAVVDIYDVAGRILFTHRPLTQQGAFDLDCSSWSSGVYFVVLRIGQTPLLSTPMIIQK